MGTTEERLPTYNYERFGNQQLAISAVQVRFPPLPRFNDQKVLTDVKAAIAEEYPLIVQSAIMNMVVTPQGVSQTPGGTAWRFTTIDRKWAIELSDSSVTLETREYEERDDFAARFTGALQIVARLLRPQYQLRFGLRYVNEFRHPKGQMYADWVELLNSELLGLGAKDILGGTIEQTVGEVRTRRSDGTLLVRHGFLNGTTVVPLEGQIQKTGPFYLLDLDYYDEDAKKFHIGGVAEQMARYNAVLYRVFRWSIGDGEMCRYLRGEA